VGEKDHEEKRLVSDRSTLIVGLLFQKGRGGGFSIFRPDPSTSPPGPSTPPFNF
jgi:hypothetical protein